MQLGDVYATARAALMPYELPCDGAIYNRVDYPELYAALDSVYINDADTFHTPNLPGRTIVGAGQGTGLTNRVIGASGGQETVVLNVSQLPEHTHGYYTPTFNIDIESVGVPDPTGVGNPPVLTQTLSEGSNQEHPNMQPFEVLRYVIVAKIST